MAIKLSIDQVKTLLKKERQVISEETRAGNNLGTVLKLVNVRYEAERNPHISAKTSIIDFIRQYTKIYISSRKQTEVERIAEEIQKTGIKKMDSLHIACAIISSADYFLSTDKRLLKYQTNRIKILNPIAFISEMEEQLW